MSNQTKQKPTPFGQTTEKDQPFFLLNSVLGAWGQPKNKDFGSKIRKRAQASRQQDLFGLMA